MFDFWSRYTNQPGHDDLHGRSASIEEDERLDSSTVRFSLDRFNYCRGLVATGYTRISRYQIFFSSLSPRREIIVRNRPYRNEECSIFLVDAHF